MRIRAPGGKLLVRRFLARHSLQVLLDYIAAQGFHTQDYKVLTTFPRKDVSLTIPCSQRTQPSVFLFAVYSAQSAEQFWLCS